VEEGTVIQKEKVWSHIRSTGRKDLAYFLPYCLIQGVSVSSPVYAIHRQNALSFEKVRFRFLVKIHFGSFQESRNGGL
jgi:hypothetical protein